MSRLLIKSRCPKHMLDSHNILVRQRTIGSPLRDYIPVLRAVGQVRYWIMTLLGSSTWAIDKEVYNAHEFRKKQHIYIDKMLRDLRERLASGDLTPSIMGNIMRQGLLNDEEILLASYTGSMFLHLTIEIPCF